MDVRNCKGCGRLFNYLQGPQLCPVCVEELEDKFTQVKKYLEEFPNATIPEVSKDNDVTSKQIEQWIREERLAFAENSPLGIACEKCGALIKSGRYCEKCRGKITNTLRSALKTPPSMNTEKKSISDRDRMRFLDSNNTDKK